MADKGFLFALLNRLPADIKPPLQEAFTHVCDTFRLGGGERALNMAWYRAEGVTSSNANTEFSVAHGLAAVPSKVIPYLDLTVINSQMPVLTVTRAPDARRIYLSSPSTGVTFSIYLE